jgi:hypothetical protein
VSDIDHPRAARAGIADENESALLLDGFDEAFVGIAYRCGQPALAVYDYDRCLAVLLRDDELSFEQAVEHLEYNTLGAWMGEHTPAIVRSYESLVEEPVPFETLETIERRHIESTLCAVRGNKSWAARELGIDRRTLYRKMAAWAQADRKKRSG